MCVCFCVSVHAYRGQKGESDPSSLELEGLISCLKWVQGSKFSPVQFSPVQSCSALVTAEPTLCIAIKRNFVESVSSI